jgi:hypothetical protein
VHNNDKADLRERPALIVRALKAAKRKPGGFF